MLKNRKAYIGVKFNETKFGGRDDEKDENIWIGFVCAVRHSDGSF